VIEVHLNIKGYPVVIADTAGIRESIDEVENEGIRRSLQRASNADLKIIVIDANDTDGEDKVIGLIDENTIVVVNKIDLSSQKQGYLNERSEFREPCYLGPQATGQEQNCTRSQIVRVSSPLREQETLTSGMTISLSAKENIGIDELLTKISNFTEQFFSNASSQPLITRERYRTNLSACASTLQALDLTQDLVLVAEDLRMAAQALGRITGEIDVETVLDEIFLSFCIGK
jgi:tRNA modification GTPase